mmetsp:Transcript_31661/g.92845  ORF Transcript_31661/g.92845 Transcript_31661/m.92845 type:complete len:300 (-) Transcript_31661:127-1026(-)
MALFHRLNFLLHSGPVVIASLPDKFQGSVGPILLFLQDLLHALRKNLGGHGAGRKTGMGRQGRHGHDRGVALLQLRSRMGPLGRNGRRVAVGAHGHGRKPASQILRQRRTSRKSPSRSDPDPDPDCDGRPVPVPTAAEISRYRSARMPVRAVGGRRPNAAASAAGVMGRGRTTTAAGGAGRAEFPDSGRTTERSDRLDRGESMSARRRQRRRSEGVVVVVPITCIREVSEPTLRRCGGGGCCAFPIAPPTEPSCAFGRLREVGCPDHGCGRGDDGSRSSASEAAAAAAASPPTPDERPE